MAARSSQPTFGVVEVRAAGRRAASISVPSPAVPSDSVAPTPWRAAERRRGRRAAPGAATITRRLGIADEVVDLVERVGGVERQVDGAGASAGEEEDDRLRALVDLDRHAVADPDAVGPERAGQPPGQVPDVAIGEGAPVAVPDERLRRVAHSRAHQRRQ